MATALRFDWSDGMVLTKGKSESGQIRINVDSAAFTREYAEWRKMAESLNGDDIGVPGDKRTLYDWIAEQGRQRKSQRCGWIETLERLCDSDRPSVRDRRELEDIRSTMRFMMPVGDSWGETKEWVDGLFYKSGKDVETDRHLRSLINQLIEAGDGRPEIQDSIKGTILEVLRQHLPTLRTGIFLNPRNAVFPDYKIRKRSMMRRVKSASSKLDQAHKITHWGQGVWLSKRTGERINPCGGWIANPSVVDYWRPSYGHNLTRRNKRMGALAPGLFKSGHEVPESWYSDEENEAVPVIWQALFGGGKNEDFERNVMAREEIEKERDVFLAKAGISVDSAAFTGESAEWRKFVTSVRVDRGERWVAKGCPRDSIDEAYEIRDRFRKNERQKKLLESFKVFGWKNDLLTVVETGLDLLDHGIEIEIPAVAVRGKGSAEMAFRVKSIREAVRRMVKDSSFTTRSGSFATARAAKELSELPMKSGDYLDNRAVLELAGHGDLEGRVVEFGVDVSRRQMLVMAKLAGWKGDGGVGLHLTKRMWRRYKERLRRDSAIIELSRRVGWRMAIEEVEGLGAKAAVILYRSKKGDLGFYRERNSSFSKLSLSTESSYIQRLGDMDGVVNDVIMELEEKTFDEDGNSILSIEEIDNLFNRELWLDYSQYTEMRYPLHLPFGNLIRRMEHDSRPRGIRGLPRCGICNRKGHNRRTCEQAKTGNRDVCPDCPLEKCYCKD
jgi:hypothetical protein